MSYLIDDEFEETTEERQSPTEEQFNNLKDFIKTTVRSAGGKVDYCEICKLCHEQFPGVFTWGEVEKACADVQSEWDVKRTITMAAKMEVERLAEEKLVADIKAGLI